MIILEVLTPFFYTLSYAGKIVTPLKRTASSILSLIEKFKVELLPTSPSFLNLILLSEEYKNFDLKSLKIITYGTEPIRYYFKPIK